MRRFLVPIVPLAVFALLALVLWIGIRHSPDKGIIVSPLLGKPAPQFALPALLEPARTGAFAGLPGPLVPAERMGHVVRGVPCGARRCCCGSRSPHAVPLVRPGLEGR